MTTARGGTMIGFLIMIAASLGLFGAAVLAWYGSAGWRRERRMRVRKRHRRQPR